MATNEVRISILTGIGIGEHVCTLNDDQFSALQFVLAELQIPETRGAVMLKAVNEAGKTYHWDLGVALSELLTVIHGFQSVGK